IVCATQQPHPLRRGLTAPRERLDVIEFELPPRRATVPVAPDECAAVPVACRHGSTHARWNGSRRRRLDCHAMLRPYRSAELAPFDLRDQRVEGPVEELGGIP